MFFGSPEHITFLRYEVLSPQRRYAICEIFLITYHWLSNDVNFWSKSSAWIHIPVDIQCVPEKRKLIKQINFSENYNDLSKKVYIVAKFSSSSFFWHQIQDVLAMHGRARTISNCDVKIDLRRIGGKGLTGTATFQNKGVCWKDIH